MNCYYVKVLYPDLTLPNAPELQTIFMVYAANSEAAIEKGFQFGLAVVREMMRRNRISPYEIDYAASALVRVIQVKRWQGKENY